MIKVPLHGGGVGVGATEISTRLQPSSSGEADSPARGAIAREELITAAAVITTAAAAIANLVARVIEPFISLWHCRLEGKKAKIRQREVLGNHS